MKSNCKVSYWVSCYGGEFFWWTSWNRGGWKLECEPTCSNHAILRTKKQAFKCANQLLDKGGSEVIVARRFKHKGKWLEMSWTFEGDEK